MAQSVKGLLCSHEDPSLISSILIKKLTVVASACHPSAGRQGQEYP